MDRYSVDPFQPIFEFVPRSRVSRLDSLQGQPSDHPIRTKGTPLDYSPSNPRDHQPIQRVCNGTSGRADTKPDPNVCVGRCVL